MTHNLYFGDLHNHCSISYGHGTVEQAIARAAQQLDFCSITGHAFWPDMPTDRETYGDIIDYHNAGFSTLAKNWQSLVEQQSAATKPGSFIAFPSYEWHSLKFGDHNVYSAYPGLSLQDAADVQELRSLVSDYNGIAIPHHIGYKAGYRGINWDHYREDCSPFVEIFSLHGCSLSDDAPYPMLHDMGPRDFGSTAEAGWQRGFKFGIVGGTDHHAAYPGSHGDGLMGVFAEELTRESLWDAFLKRRVYAITGDKIDARMFLDGAWIGETVNQPGPRTFQISVRGSDAIDKVEVIKNGKIAGRLFPKPVEPNEKSHRYKLRITWGWGRNTVPVNWSGSVQLSEGEIVNLETCFAGQAIVAPQTGDEISTLNSDPLLPHAVENVSSRGFEFRSVTQGNKSMRHETSQAVSLEIEAPLSSTLTVEVNGQKYQHSLEELHHKARSHYLRGLLSEAIRIGPLVPIEECTVEGEFSDEPDQEIDVYRLQVAQQNGQYAWLTPIWVER